MRKLILLAFLSIFLLSSTVLAQEIPDYNDLYVNDFADVFTDNQTSELRILLSSVEETTTAEVTVLTVDTVSPMAMSQYAQEVFEKWGIGKADKDNGLLILYAKQEDKIWVATGYGLEGILPDSKVGRILDETFVPMRADNDSAQGIVLAAIEYSRVINENAEEVMSGDASPVVTSFDVLMSLIVMFMPLIFMAIFFYRAYDQAHPKCSCGGRAEIVKTEVKEEKKSGIFGIEMTSYYTIVTYKCKKCGKKFKKRKEGRQRMAGVFLFAGSGGFSGGGFGGGFGGGGFGGGGAGR